MKIDLDGSVKALNPCKICGSVKGILVDCPPPHVKRINCDGCGRFHGWLGLDKAIELGLFVQERN